MSKGRQPGYWRRYRAPPWWFRLGGEEAPQTHEKTTQTLMLAFKVIVVGTVAYLLLGALWGCNRYRPTGPSSEREILMTGYVSLRCSQLGIAGVATRFTDVPYFPYDDHPTWMAAAWAWPYSKLVTVYAPILLDEERYPDYVLDLYARHECCHISGIWDEAEANACAIEHWGE